MIDKEKWIDSIKEEIQEISDKEFQERVWVKGNGPEVSSYVELMCRLFDDKHFNEFIKNGQSIGLGKTLLSKLKDLKNDLENYKEKNKDEEIVIDPKWEEIREKAKKILNTWSV